jgi:hypothetical protein
MLDCALPPQASPPQIVTIPIHAVQVSADTIQSHWQLIKDSDSDKIWHDHQDASNASPDEIELYNICMHSSKKHVS